MVVRWRRGYGFGLGCVGSESCVRDRVELNARRVVSREESLGGSIAAAARNGVLQAVLVLDADSPMLKEGAVGQSGYRFGDSSVVDGGVGEGVVVRNVVASEVKRDSLGMVGRVLRMEAVSRASRTKHTEVARAAVIRARRLQCLALSPSKGGSGFASEGLRQHMSRAKRKFASLTGSGEAERPLGSSRGLTMVTMAVEPSIL